MTIKEYSCVALERMPEVAKALMEAYPGKRVFTFAGDLGAGKTQLIKEICSVLGVQEAVQSPTYPIVHEYRPSGDGVVYHMDLYRIKSQNELIDLGFEDYLLSGYFCFIEWPEVADNLLPVDSVRVKISVATCGRNITMECDEQI
ncbi:MAG: tRNA (adenosine(37)-N6)-threonylcarbamoyltransferase complex ATPase subunit type 1 TsaE [Flavobacteriales bacterium]|nr:tRNA (adenosine(37)-N6)-threonylcarbamoyltransferase complex ATPase subunit type 1 TsaE [Flavobacteriales bacterium]MCB9446908.1 tRNA (adenosine(37)-N6)-threonylcarbamoyltransferase complex ATPase subunit type 1 TsaE [Flavobacteriales bacterium]